MLASRHLPKGLFLYVLACPRPASIKALCPVSMELAFHPADKVSFYSSYVKRKADRSSSTASASPSVSGALRQLFSIWALRWVQRSVIGVAGQLQGSEAAPSCEFYMGSACSGKQTHSR
jgi:hypothetical protein